MQHTQSIRQRLVQAAALLMLAGPVLGETPGEVAEGTLVRDVAMRGLSGEARRLSEFRGKPVIVNVWASYCGPCLAEMGSLERLSKRLGDQVRIIGVSIDDYPERAKAFLEKAGTSFPHFIDEKLTIENMLGANRIPLTVLIDADGRVLHKVYGAREWDGEPAYRAITKAFSLPDS
ncbi:MAG: TlpA family protein disulfide reductase [Rhodocyclaceae bacterium]|nr:TlpA family protein disulfide reductase [Rhodocyclaceae bacterium]